jgi:hypothetical protein
MTHQSETNSTCCPEFDPMPWDDKTFEWKDKGFIRDRVSAFFYMPLNFGKVMKRFDEKVTRAGATVPDWLCLSHHTSWWNMDIYLAVDRKIPDAENTKLSGKFYCKVYEGAFRETGKWCKDFLQVAKPKGLKNQKLFMWYTTCPKCAKKYGKNQVAILAEVE